MYGFYDKIKQMRKETAEEATTSSAVVAEKIEKAAEKYVKPDKKTTKTSKPIKGGDKNDSRGYESD